MADDIIKHESHGIFTPEQEKMIRNSFLSGASREEAEVLLEVARARKLNPITKQIHFVKRWDSKKGCEVWSYQTSIDGLRLIAERSGQYEGQTKTEWCDKDGIWVDVWLKEYPPAAARVGVYRKGFREPVYGVAKYEAFVQRTKDGKPTSFWSRMGDHMLAKCAEAHAIRRTFPEDAGGLYTSDELDSGVESGGSPSGRGGEVTPEAAILETARILDAAIVDVSPIQPGRTSEARAPSQPAVQPAVIAPEKTAIPDKAMLARKARLDVLRKKWGPAFRENAEKILGRPLPERLSMLTSGDIAMLEEST